MLAVISRHFEMFHFPREKGMRIIFTKNR